MQRHLIVSQYANKHSRLSYNLVGISSLVATRHSPLLLQITVYVRRGNLPSASTQQIQSRPGWMDAWLVDGE